MYSRLQLKRITWLTMTAQTRFTALQRKNNKQMLVQLNKVGESHAAVQLLVEACSTNWEGNNTAKTMKFKRQPMVSSDAGITTTMANKADRPWVSITTDYDGVSFLAEGRTVGTELFFIDSKVGRDALCGSFTCRSSYALNPTT